MTCFASPKLSRLRILIIFLLLISYGACADTNKIVLVSSDDTYNSRYGCWLSHIYKDAFSRLGYEFIYRGVPGGRAPLMAEKGEVDGEIHRAFEYQQQTKSLRRVDESPFDVTFEAYVIQNNLKFHDWSELGNHGLKVEFRRGTKRAEGKLKQAVAPSLLSDVTSTEQGLKKLLRGRTDVFIEQSLVFQDVYASLIKKSETYGVIHSAGIVDKLPSYVYLNRRHDKLINDLAKTIKEMKREGLIDIYRHKPCDMNEK
jgi:polar amino acid transport system substrate-binding protein